MLRRVKLCDLDPDRAYFHFTKTIDLSRIEKNNLTSQISASLAMADNTKRIHFSTGVSSILKYHDVYLKWMMNTMYGEKSLRKKYDDILIMKDIIIEETDVPEKSFDEVVKLKKQNLSSFDLERKLTEYNNLIIKINDDYDNLLGNIRFNNYFNELNEINQKLEAAKSFYNKYTSILNKYTKKFPSNVIAYSHNIKTRAFFDGKDMFDEDLKDFKL